MANKARDYKPSTVRRLDILSGNQCAAPDCDKLLIARDGDTIISKICHIEAASNNGPRYNPGMTDDERRHFNNLLLLCDECHSMVDNRSNEQQYPVPLLKEWKKNHENKQLYKLNRKPSLLALAVNAIASVDFEDTADSGTTSLRAPDINNKISHNSIIRNKTLIEEYRVFHAKVNTLYNELEAQGSFKKERLLRNIRHLYLIIKGNYVGNSANPLEIIRANADNIIEDVENELLAAVSNDRKQYPEDIAFSISIIMVDAFMRCKILEEPPIQ